MAARRVLPISLPASDPASAAISRWLDALPAGADVSGEARRLLALAIELAPALAGIEAQLARLSAGAPARRAARGNDDDEETQAALGRLFTFEV